MAMNLTKLLACFLLASVVALSTITTPASGQTDALPGALAALTDSLNKVVGLLPTLTSADFAVLRSALTLVDGAIRGLLPLVTSLEGLGIELSTGFANLILAVLNAVLALIAILLALLSASDTSVSLVGGLLNVIVGLLKSVLVALGGAV